MRKAKVTTTRLEDRTNRAMKKTNLFIATLVAASILQAGFASAALISVINAGFEDPVLVDAGSTDTAPPGWNFSFVPENDGEGGVWNPPTGAYPAEAPEGDNVGWLWDYSPWGSGEISLDQTLLSVLTANTHYTLEVEIGDPLSYNGDDYDGFPGYRVELLAGGTVLSFDNNTLTITEGTFETSVVTFFAPSGHAKLGEALEIKLFNLAQPTPGGDGNEVDYDNVRLTSVAIPEPSTFSMLAFCGIAMAGYSRLRRRRK
jgi:hypothetical protein